MMGRKNKVAMKKVNILPNEIEENILSRVPVSTIVRFMSVCKAWHSLFLHPYFIKLHLKNNKNNNTNGNNITYKGRELVPALVVTDSSSVVHSRLVLDPQPDQIKIVGSCNGIVCVEGLQHRCSERVVTKYIYLWNPALRVVKNIKKSEWHIGSGSLVSERIVLGFGFDSHSKDHKVIRFQISYVMKQVEIYSLSLDSWRIVKASAPHINMDCFLGYLNSTLGVCVNGVHHWPVIIPKKYAHEEYTHSVVIISFDMGKEVFKETMTPSKWRKRGMMSILNYRFQLFNYNESLAMLIFNAHNLNYDIWVMNDYDTLAESWTKLCKIDTLRVGCRYFHGFVQMKNEVTLSEVKDSSISTANINLLKDATEIMCFKESLLLLDSNNLEHL